MLFSNLLLGLAAKKVLIVYAHQSSASFNSAAKDAAKEVLAAQGCTVEVSDLYAMKFKATATAEDITGTSVTPWHQKVWHFHCISELNEMLCLCRRREECCSLPLC